MVRRLVLLLIVGLWVCIAPRTVTAFLEDISRFERITVGDEVPVGDCTPYRALHVMMPKNQFLLCNAEGTGYTRTSIDMGSTLPLTCEADIDTFFHTTIGCMYVCNAQGNNWIKQAGCPSGASSAGTGIRTNDDSILTMRRAVTNVTTDLTLGQHLLVQVFTQGNARIITLPDPSDPLMPGWYKVRIADNTVGTVRLRPAAGVTINGRSADTDTITGQGSYFVAERVSDTEWAVDMMGPVVVGDVFLGANNTYGAFTQNFSAATGLTLRTGAGCTPTANGEHCYDTTKRAHMFGGDGVTGAVSRVRSVTTPNETKTNNTIGEQDFASVYTVPANFFTLNKRLCLTLLTKYTTDAAASNLAFLLKLGSTVVYQMGDYFVPFNNATQMYEATWCFTGTAAPGASVGVYVAPALHVASRSEATVTAQPVLLATNGTLTVVPVAYYDTNTSGESLTIVKAIIEEMN